MTAATTVAIRALLLALAVTACSRDAADDDPSAVDPGLIVNPRFETADGGTRPANWGISQHAGEPSYEVTASDGVLAIRRIGEEPWGLVSQKLDVTGLAGKKLAFSMDLAGELDESRGPALQPPGLVVRLLGRAPADLPMLGKRRFLAINEEPGLAAGTHGWSRHELRFEVPEGRDLELTVGVQMTMDGTLRARAPRLGALDESASR